MLVMVRDLLYLIQLIKFCILQNKPLLCLIFYMFQKLRKDSYLFNNFVVKIVFFLVSLYFFYVKDLITKTVLLSGQTKNGLYILTESSAMCFPQAFLPMFGIVTSVIPTLVF